MSLSPNEIESLAKTAARGAGLSWGMAEQAAKATRWLAARGFEACDPLLALLFRHDEEGHAQTGPKAPDRNWHGAEGWLCPIACGVALSDLGAAAPLPLTMHRVACPILLLPFAAGLAQDYGRPMHLSWVNGSAVTDGDGVDISAPPAMSDVTLSAGAAVAHPSAQSTHFDPDQMILVSLNIYAARTRAPRPRHHALEVPGRA